MSPDLLRVGEHTPFALRDQTGCLLMPSGVYIATEAQRQLMISRPLYIADNEAAQVKRALAGAVDTMVRRNDRLGLASQAQHDASGILGNTSASMPCRRLEDPAGTWASFVLRTAALLRDAGQEDFLRKCLRLQSQLAELVTGHADDALLTLVHTAANDFRDYSAAHATLVCVVCELAARHLTGWAADMRTALRCAALTMNVGMTALQNQLATQHGAPTELQRAIIARHGADGAAVMRANGVCDALWLTAVEHHHDTSSGPLADLPAALQVARLIRRADIFAARLSPRKARAAMSGCSAAKAAFLGDDGRPDDAGSAIVKAIGICPPGSLVRLSCGEVAVVLRQGRRANEPVVASVLSTAGTPLAVPALRETRRKPYDVVSGVAPQEVKLLLNVGSLLKLA